MSMNVIGAFTERRASSITLTALWVCGTIVCIDAALDALHFGPTPGRLATGAVLLLLLNGAAFFWLIRMPDLRIAGAMPKESVVPLLAFGLTRVALSRVGHYPLSLWLSLAVLLAGSVEEALYRIAIPLVLRLSLTNADQSTRAKEVYSRVLAQVLFAFSHAAPAVAHMRSFSLLESVRLFTTGILYCVLIDRVGFWVTSAVHASLNLGILLGLQDLASHVSWALTLTWLGLGAALLVAGSAPHVHTGQSAPQPSSPVTEA